MANYLTKGNKTVYCKDGHPNAVPFVETDVTCTICKERFFVKFFGTVTDKHGNYIY